MLLNEEQIRGLKDGIEQGLILGGYTPDDKDKAIIQLSVTTTLGVIERMMDIDNNSKSV